METIVQPEWECAAVAEWLPLSRAETGAARYAWSRGMLRSTHPVPRSRLEAMRAQGQPAHGIHFPHSLSLSFSPAR